VSNQAKRRRRRTYKKTCAEYSK